MADSPDHLAAIHRRAGARFAGAVAAVDGRWKRPTPCPDWDTRGLLEHVIGFHDVLLLRPLDAKPHRPRDEPGERWAVTLDALDALLDRPGLFDGPIEVAGRDGAPATTIDGADDRLDEDLCAWFLARLPADPDALAASGMFAPPVAIPDDADGQTRLLARLGRDPSWTPPDP
jgi:hypothetical protein